MRARERFPGVPLLSQEEALSFGKDPSSRASRLKQGSSGCERDSRACSQVETSMSVNFLCCSKGVKDPLEVPDVRCD